MTSQIDPGSLVAYVDGELAPDEMLRVEAAMAEDEECRKTVRQLREATALLRGAYNDIVAEPLPANITTLLGNSVKPRATSKGTTQKFTEWRGWIPLALVASLAVLFIGLPGGYFLAQQQIAQQITAHEAAHRADQLAMAAAISRALEEHLSGQTVDWQNPDSGSRVSVTPIRTFKNHDGRWCREYSERSHLAGVSREQRAIACRNSDGLWQTQLVTFDES